MKRLVRVRQYSKHGIRLWNAYVWAFWNIVGVSSFLVIAPACDAGKIPNVIGATVASITACASVVLPHFLYADW